MTFTEEISEIIHIDIDTYFTDVVNFFFNDDPLIQDYYRDSTILYPYNSFKEFERLRKLSTDIINKFVDYKGNFNNIGHWDIFDKIESINLKYDTILDYPKFYKVTSVRNQDVRAASESVILKQHQTLENLANDKELDWTDIAVENYLREEDYNQGGGQLLVLKASPPQNVTDNGIESIIDVAIGENLLGKDLPEQIEIDEYEEDLVVLSPEDTFFHTVHRLLSLNKGSLPEFPDLGIQRDIMSEATKGNGILFPIITRQMSECLYTDDTILSFAITDIRKDQDNLFFEIDVEKRDYEKLSYMLEVTPQSVRLNNMGDPQTVIVTSDSGWATN